MLSDWLISLEGTEAGRQLALTLAVSAAFLHAVFGALQKGRHDPWLTRGAIDASYGLMAAPFALFVVPWPEPHMWVIFAGAWLIHIIYTLTAPIDDSRSMVTQFALRTDTEADAPAADIIAFDGDPYADVTVLESVDWVMARGAVVK